jgi:hypothetical protein
LRPRCRLSLPRAAPTRALSIICRRGSCRADSAGAHSCLQSRRPTTAPPRARTPGSPQAGHAQCLVSRRQPCCEYAGIISSAQSCRAEEIGIHPCLPAVTLVHGERVCAPEPQVKDERSVIHLSSKNLNTAKQKKPNLIRTQLSSRSRKSVQRCYLRQFDDAQITVKQFPFQTVRPAHSVQS